MSISQACLQRCPARTPVHRPRGANPRAQFRCNAAAKVPAEVLTLIEAANLHTCPEEVGALVRELARGGQAPADPARAALRGATGAWEVFYAPHIRTLGTLLLSRVEPVRYQYQAAARGGAGELVSHVRLVNALGTFHLSSAARLFEKDAGALGIEFTNFWFDYGKDAMRDYHEDDNAGDRAVSAVGRLVFAAEGNTFPVKYMDGRLAVFLFPLLNVPVAIRKVE